MGHVLLDFTEHFVSPTPRTGKSDWYHGTLGRNQAIETLKNCIGNPDGSFLVRYSGHSGYVLTMLYLEQPYNFQIHMQVILSTFLLKLKHRNFLKHHFGLGSLLLYRRWTLC